MWRMFANIYLYLPLIFSNGVTRHVVECDKLRFQPEIICNVCVKQCLQISIYFYPLFSQMVKNDMLLSMINSDFSQKSFVMLCKECLQIYIYFVHDMLLTLSNGELSNGVKRHVVEHDKLRIQPEIICNAVWRMFANIYLLFTPNSLKWCHTRWCWVRWTSDFCQNSIVMLCQECLQISIYIYPLFYPMVSHDMLLSVINSDFCQKSFVMLYVNNACKYLFIFTPYFLKWCHTTCCWVW